MGKGITDKDSEWEKRTLCSDGNCIGVIGPDGRCKECGKAYDGEAPLVEEDIPEEESIPDLEVKKTAEAEAEPEPPERATSEETEDITSEWENRRLCSDGNCIGVIGPDGKCKECGKPFEG